jgi:Glycosyl hydrolases family 43/delta endotoxin
MNDPKRFALFLTTMWVGTMMLMRPSWAQPLASPGNPIAAHIFAADPAAHVWPDDPDTVWLYTSHDHAEANNFESMTDYHAFSSRDLVNWTDHGQILSVKNVPWAASHAWAVDAAFYQGRYYLIFCMKDQTQGVFLTGLAVSDRPEGPFHDIGTIKGSEWGQDPALFIDEDQQPYLYWGHDYTIYAAKLTKDLREIIPDSRVELTRQLKDSYEAPWVNKIEGKYYLSYAGIPGRKWPENLYYARADHPLGPYESMGPFLGDFPLAAATNHQSIISFKGKWIAFYHSAWGSAGNSYTRSLMADFLEIGEDAKWKPVVPSMKGITGGVKPSSRIWLEAENGSAAGGNLVATHPATELKGFSGTGYVTGFAIKSEHAAAYYAAAKDCPNCLKRSSVGSVQVLAQVAFQQRYHLRIRYAAPQDTKIDLLVGNLMIKPGTDSPNAFTLPSSPTDFVTLDLADIPLKAGDNLITLRTKENLDVMIDAFELTPLY